MHQQKSESGKKSWKKGILAERLGIILLIFKGYRVMEHRFRTPLGEIDILAVKGKTLVCIEVKSRSSSVTALESITTMQRYRIERALMWYITKNSKLSGLDIRFDIILVSKSRIQHIKNAWFAGDY